MSDPHAPVSPDRPAHLDLDALADVLAGERPDDPHLRGCSSCVERLAELETAEPGVLGRLAALPAPQVPADVLARLSASLAAAAPPSAGLPSTAESSTAESSTADLTSVRRLPRRRHARAGWQPAVAASLVLVLGGALGWTALQGVDVGSSDDTASSAQSGADAGGRSSDDTSLQESAPDRTTAEGAAPQPSDGDADAPEQTAPDQALPRPATSTGADWADPAARATALTRVLTGPAGEQAPTAAAFVDEALARLRAPEELAGCLDAAGAGPSLLGVDFARFGALPAVAVLSPSPEEGQLRLTVVGAGCSAADPDVLLRTAVPRPG